MKMNSLSLQQQEYKFEQDLDYEEYLRHTDTEPSTREIDDMEKVFCKSVILKRSFPNPSNTLNYQPLQGA